ncbi:hypothetical protein HOI83_01025 [Candidatus Uhrbacteria bacterium]|jgi:hypothetical protein|nr:hypothetical protein [Candidatus Uhrbacteria bacterium]
MLNTDMPSRRCVLVITSLRRLERRLLAKPRDRVIPISSKPASIGYDYPAQQECGDTGLLDRQFHEAREIALELEMTTGPVAQFPRRLAC